MHVGLMIWSLTYSKGGMERAGSELGNYLVEHGYDVSIFYNDNNKQERKPIYPVSDKIILYRLKVNRQGEGMRQARETIVQSAIDILVVYFSWSEFLLIPALLHKTGIPLIYAERGNSYIIRQNLWNPQEHTACASGSDKIVLFWESFRNAYPEFLHDRIVVIPNAIKHSPAMAQPGKARNNSYTLLSVGRFVDNKQFILLLTAFAGLAESFPEWNLRICGTGVQLSLYEDFIKAANLQKRIFLPGLIEDIRQEYAAAHLFCLPSRYEGFGQVTAEAMRSGLPAVGFAQCSGTCDIIEHGINGMLAPKMNAESLAQTLYPLMRSPSLRAKMGMRASETAAQFDPETVYPKWITVLEESAQYKNRTKLNFSIDTSEEAKAHIMLTSILQREYPFEQLDRKL